MNWKKLSQQYWIVNTLSACGGIYTQHLYRLEFDWFQSQNTLINEAHKKLRNLPKVGQLLREKKM